MRVVGDLDRVAASESAYMFAFDTDPQSGTMTPIDPYFRAFEVGNDAPQTTPHAGPMKKGRTSGRGSVAVRSANVRFFAERNATYSPTE
jgi:hypothetical protein